VAFQPVQLAQASFLQRNQMFQSVFLISVISTIGNAEMAHSLSKGAFFQKVRFVFRISKSPKKNIPKNYPELEI
jgi:hypothetical protein